jgi:mannose-6-phosphate isomerase-like protein (cupin superfamily)
MPEQLTGPGDGQTLWPWFAINADGPKVHLYRLLTLDHGEHLIWKLELQDGKLVGTYSALHDRPSKWVYDRELEVALVRGEPLASGLDELEWGPPHGGNGFPVGVRTAPQGVDPVSGGNTYYAMFPAGSHFDLHWHTHDEYAVVVAGSLTIRLGDEDHALAVGSYIVIPGGLKHSWTVPEGGNDAVIFVRRAGPPDFHFVKD